MKAYVISLARSTERGRRIRHELNRTSTPYEMVDAVDGLEVDLGDASLVDPRALAANHSWLGRGAIGCALSHLKAYRQALAERSEHALVLEDDVLLPDDFRQMSEEVASHLRGAEVALLHFRSFEPCRIATEGSRPLASGRLLASAIDPHQLIGGAAYLMTREACESLADFILPVRVTADSWSSFIEAGALAGVKCVVPSAVQVNARHRTTLRHQGRSSYLGRALDAADRYRLPPLYQLGLAYRGRRIRRHSRIEFVPGLVGPSPSRQLGPPTGR